MSSSKLSVALILVLFFHSPLASQQSSRLNEDWEFVKQDLGGIWEAVRPGVKGNPESVPLWQTIILPHCVNAEDAVDPDVNYYQGPAWYRTKLLIDNPYKNGRTILHFEGAGQKTDVYVYTTKVGSHTGGYDEWTVDITDAVTAFRKTGVYTKQFNQRIPLSVRTDNSRDLEMIPSDLSDFNVYGGIYRYLNLVYVPAVSVDKIFISQQTTKEGKASELQVKARFYDPSTTDNTDVLVTLLDPSGKFVQQMEKKLISLKGDIDLGSFTIKKPKLWSTENPFLYTVELNLGKGSNGYVHRKKIGFRHAQFVQKGPFLLNGKRLLLKGTHRHEDHAGVAAAMSEEQIRQEMYLMKEMGVNFIRLGHYQQSRIVLNLCDSLGILVWEEIPWCRGGLGGEVYKDQARRMLTNMIEQHYNHPSVIIWGLGNENDWPGDFAEFDKKRIREFMSELNDLSYGADADPRIRSFEPVRFDKSVEYTTRFHQYYLKEMLKRPFVAAAMIWNLADFNSETREETMPHINNKGLLTWDRIPKDPYYFYQAMLSKKPFIKIAAAYWNSRTGIANSGSRICYQPLQVASNLDSVEIIVNGTSLGWKKPGEGMSEWTIPFINGCNIIEAKGVSEGKWYTDRTVINFRLQPYLLNDTLVPFQQINILSGANRYFFDASTGQTWQPDQPYRAGSWGYLGGKPFKMKVNNRLPYGTDKDILNTDDDPVYQTQLAGISSYRFDVGAGNYELTLHFAEIENIHGKNLSYNLSSSITEKRN